MPLIHLIDGLDLELSHGLNLNGEVLQPCAVRHDGEDPIPVYLSQGSLDGACGVYAVLMGLTISGAFQEQSDAEYAVAHGIGHLSASYKNLRPLLTEGLSVTQLRKLLRAFDEDTVGWNLQKVPGEPGSIAQFREVIKALWNSPVLLGVPGHWTLAIGWELAHSTQATLSEGSLDEATRRGVDRLLLIDPSQPPPVSVYWNTVLTRANKNGPPRFYYSGARYEEKTMIDSAYVLRKARRRKKRSKK